MPANNPWSDLPESAPYLALPDQRLLAPAIAQRADLYLNLVPLPWIGTR